MNSIILVNTCFITINIIWYVINRHVHFGVLKLVFASTGVIAFVIIPKCYVLNYGIAIVLLPCYVNDMMYVFMYNTLVIWVADSKDRGWIKHIHYYTCLNTGVFP